MKILRCIWLLLVGLHSAIIFANAAAFFFLPFLTPWYIAVPCCTIIGRVLFTDVRCPLTVLENRLRKKLGMPQIDKFVSHYFLWKKTL